MARAAGAFGAVVAIFFATVADAQGWKPERNVELIVPASAGGSLDTTGRTVQRLWDELKLLPVSSTVANRSGGGHAVAYNFLNQRVGDPHYMSITSSTLHTSNINGRTPLSYRDFSLVVPTQPGLGVELDEERVEAFRRDRSSSRAYSMPTRGDE